MGQRNYGAMHDEKLRQCLQELTSGAGDAYDRALVHGDPAHDLGLARAAAQERGWETDASSLAADDAADGVAVTGAALPASTAAFAADRSRELSANGLEHCATALFKHAKLAVSFSRSDATTGSSRLGGIPDVPADFDWPHYQQRPLAFVAQFDLADLPADEFGLPEDGLLAFFYDADEMPWGDWPAQAGSGHVFYFPVKQPLQSAVVPDALTQDDLVFPAVFLQARLTVTWPSFNEFISSPADADALYERDRQNQQTPRHQLGGCGYVIQHDPLLEVPLPDSAPPPQGGVDVRAPQTDWRLLLQIDTDGDAGFLWGDAGILYVCITATDLAALRFDRAWTSMQCS